MAKTWDEYKKTMDGDNLWLAVKDRSLARVDSLLRAGNAINVKDARGYSPLMLAAYAGNLEMVRYLLDHSADPNSTDTAGNTILMGVAFKGYAEIVKALLAAGARTNVVNHQGLDAYDYASTFGRAEVKAILSANGVRKENRKGKLFNFFKLLLARPKRTSQLKDRRESLFQHPKYRLTSGSESLKFGNKPQAR